MPRFFFHLRDGTEQLLDPDGQIMPRENVADAALAQARDCIAGDVLNGRMVLHYRIEVHDEADRMVHTLDFSDAVQVLPKNR